MNNKKIFLSNIRKNYEIIKRVKNYSEGQKYEEK